MSIGEARIAVERPACSDPVGMHEQKAAGRKRIREAADRPGNEPGRAGKGYETGRSRPRHDRASHIADPGELGDVGLKIETANRDGAAPRVSESGVDGGEDRCGRLPCMATEDHERRT